jgi:hypothetical protein
MRKCMFVVCAEMTYAYVIFPFFRGASYRDIYDLVPKCLYSTWADACEAAEEESCVRNLAWEKSIQDYELRHPGTPRRHAEAFVRASGITHMIPRLHDRSQVECIEFGNCLAYFDEAAEARRQKNIMRWKLGLFLIFLVSASGFLSISYYQMAVFVLLLGINVCVYMFDRYVQVPREQMEGLWIVRIDRASTL